MAKQDDELLTMSRLDRILSKLPPEVRQRVMAWLVARHGEPEKVAVQVGPGAG